MRPPRHSHPFRPNRHRTCALVAVGVLTASLTGCKRPAPPPLGPDATTFRNPTRVTVQLERYLPFHPAAAEVDHLDREIALLRQPIAVRAIGVTLASEAPEHTEPSAPRMIQVPPPPSAKVDYARAERAIREDFTIRRLAEPDPAEERFQAELARLRRSFVELRSQPSAAQEAQALADAIERGRRLSELGRQIERLAPTPEDRLLYRIEVLRDRRRQRDAMHAELTELKHANLAALERALETPVVQPAPVPTAMIRRAEAERDRVRAELQVELAAAEKRALDASAAMTVPAPDWEPVIPTHTPHPSGTRERLADRTRTAVASAASKRPPAVIEARDAAARRDTIERLSRQRQALRSAMLHDLRVTVSAVARARGESIDVGDTHGSSDAPDRTLVFLPEVKKSLLAAGSTAAGNRNQRTRTVDAR